MRALRILFGVLGWLLILFLLALAGAVALVSTEQGTRWLFEQAERHAPVDFRVDGVEGTLFRGLSLRGVQVDTGDTRVQLDRGQVWVDALPLLRLTLRVRELTLAGVRVELPEIEPEPPEPTALPELPEAIEIPLHLVIERFSLTDLQLLRAGEKLLEVDRLALRLDAGPQTLRITDLQLEMPDVQARLDAELQPVGDYPLWLEGHWRFKLPEALVPIFDTGHAEGALTAEGDLRGSLFIEHRLEAGVVLHTELLLEDLLETPRIALDNRWTPFGYPIQPDRMIEIDAGSFALRGELEDWALEARSSARIDGLPPMQLTAALRGSMQQAVIDTLSLHSDAGRIDLQGRVGLDRVLDWELQAGFQDVSSRMLGLELEAMLHVLTLTSTGQLPLVEDNRPGNLLQAITAVLDIKELRADLAGQELEGGGALSVRGGIALIDDLQLRLGAQGRLRLDGEADLGAETPFRLVLEAETLDLGFLAPGRAVAVDRLRLGAEGRVALETGALHAEVVLSELGAKVDGQEISASAALELTETAAEIRELNVFLPADGQLSVAGRVAYATGIEWDVHVSGRGIDPAVLLPDLPGRLALDLRSHGARPPG
jgi:translocation and assembly module TamB